MRAPPLSTSARITLRLCQIRAGGASDIRSLRLWIKLASKLHVGVGKETPEPIRTATMLDTALLIASALSLALMVVFSELP